jgi:hypothetical protein
MQTISFAFAGIVLIAGKRSAMRIPKIPMTTINSMSVNPARQRFAIDFIQKIEVTSLTRNITDLPADLEYS